MEAIARVGAGAWSQTQDRRLKIIPTNHFKKTALLLFYFKRFWDWPFWKGKEVRRVNKRGQIHWDTIHMKVRTIFLQSFNLGSFEIDKATDYRL